MPDELLLALAAAILLTGGALLLGSVSGGDYSSRVRARLAPDLPAGEPGGLFDRIITGTLDRLTGAGIEPRPIYGWAVAGLLAASIWAAWYFQGLVGLLAAPPAVLALLYLVWSWRLKRRAAQVLEALPGFLGFMLRALRAGASMEQALEAANRESEGPIRVSFEQVLRKTRLGMPLDQALLSAAELYQLRELDMLALGLRVTQRYGGDLGQIMEHLVTLIRQHRHALAELHAMTGETRFSAWVLGGLPLGLAAYIIVTNPSYLAHATETQTGRWILIGAVIWQALGLLLLRRMVKSV